MRAWFVVAGLLSACVARPPARPGPPVRASEATPVTPVVHSSPLGAGIFVTDAGIVRRDGDPVGQVLTVERGRLLREDGELLYFFDPERPILRSVHLVHRGTTRVVLELPPIVHPAFPGVDPLAYLWRQEDLNVVGGVLCVDLRPRRDVAAPIYNLRVELATATIAGRVVTPSSPRLCAPAGPGGDGLSIEYSPFTDVIPLTP